MDSNLKSLKEISLPITEEEYRADGCMHYSTLAKYERSGFHCIASLADRIETPSLTNGSAVDSIITGGMEEFEERFFVAEMPSLSDTLTKITNFLFDTYSDQYSSIEDIPQSTLASVWDIFDKRTNWQAKTKADKIINDCGDLYKMKYLAMGKTIITADDYKLVMAQVNALKESASTMWYFRESLPFENVERLYQLKFKATFNDIDYSCMMDEVVVDHDKKIIYPIDLKTSSHFEDEFFKSFIDWSYQIQARNYWRILRANMDKDPYFKDFTLDDYRFIVVNKNTLNPLVWKFRDTQKTGTLIYGPNGEFVLRDPFTIAEELNYYLRNTPKVPIGIKMGEESDNDIIDWLNKK